MKSRVFAGLAALICTTSAAGAASAPAGLHGKSVVVSWTETRVQRFVGEGDFRTVNGSITLSVYVSSAGRVFSRLGFQTRAGAGQSDQIAGGGSSRVPSFSGNTMTVVHPLSSGGVRRMNVTFDGSFSSCSATTQFGKQEGVGRQIAKSWSSAVKRQVEIKSVSPGGVSCSVRNGNVFGGAT
jgi:hypothetical protein